MRVALGSISESVDYGLTASACHEPVGPKFLRITDLQNGSVEWNSVPWCKANEKKRQSAKLNIGDIVFARTGATTGKSFLIRECPEEAVFASYLIRVRLSNKADPRYIAHFFQTSDYWNQITQNARGAAQPGVNATKLKSLKIPLPSLVEQNRIAEILDASDALRAKRRKALTQLDTLLNSTFIDIFGDPVTNTMRWDTCRLGDVTTVGSGTGFPNEFQGEPVGKYPFYKVSDMNLKGNESHMNSHNNAISELVRLNLRANTHPAGTIIFPKIGAAIATNKKRILTSESCFDNNVMGIHPSEKISVNYLFHLLKTKDLMDFANSGNPPSIRKTALENWNLPLPPLDLQHRFAAIVEAVEEQKARMRAHLAELDALFASLQHRAFNGEL